VTIAPSIGVIGWTMGFVLFAVVVVIIGIRWSRLGRDEATTPVLTALLIVAVLTVVWLIPGVVAALGIAMITVSRRVRRTIGA
jgi:hypothetical protein